MLRKEERLTVSDIEALSRGISVFSTLISLRKIDAERLKFAVSVSKKTAPTAVMRNRIRRRVYSIVRKLMPEVRAKAYIMLLPKKEFFDAPIAALEGEVRSLFKKADLI